MSCKRDLPWYKKIFFFKLSSYKWFRKWCGGYWEKWHIEIIHGAIWMRISTEQYKSGNYRPGCGMGQPMCEYYPIGFFNHRSYFTKETKQQLIRQKKLENILCQD